MLRILRSGIGRAARLPNSPVLLQRCAVLYKPLISKPQARGITTVQPVKKRRRWPLYLVGLTALGAYGYWKWLTHHNFPPTVAELLKEGLWATINGAGYRKPDYRQALAKYIEALQEADRLQMIPWSDEYTGIQIVIADLYERLHLIPEAASMYAEVANTYLLALTKGKIPPEDVDRIITRDLRVVLLAGLLMSTDANSFKSVVEFMGPHMVLATREAAKKSEELQFLLHQYPVFNVSFLKDIKEKRLPDTIFENCWGSYRHELFAMREMMTGIAAASGEYMQALMLKMKTTQIMLTSGFATGECLLSAANIASLMYLQGVNLKFTRPNMPGVDIAEQLEESSNSDDELPLADPTLDETPGPMDAGPVGPVSPLSAALARKKRKQPSAQSFFHLADNVYSEIINTVKTMDQRRTDFIPEAYVMALYGQGVIASSQGNWDLAADRLGEARLRAKGSRIESLIATAEDQITRVEEMRALSEDEIKALQPNDLPTVDVMFWKLSPDIEDLDRPELPDSRL